MYGQFGNCYSCSGIQGFGAGEIIPGFTLPAGLPALPSLPTLIPVSQADLAATNAAVAKNSDHIKYLAIGSAAATVLILLFK